MPRVSIGLPVYNGQNFVEQAIQSVVQQTYEDWELVICDNASSDATQQICLHYAKLDPRIQYHRAAKNLGAAWNFNRVFELASGEYFRWLSHDDYLAETVIEDCVLELDRRPDVVLCATGTAVIDAQGYRVVDDLPRESDMQFQGLTEAQESLRRELSQSTEPSERFRGILMYSLRCYEIYGLIRREVMLQTQRHPAYCGGEKVLLAELALLGPFAELEAPLFYCRWHDERFTSNSSAREQAEHMSPGRVKQFALPHQYRATLGYLQLLAVPGLTLASRLRALLVWLQFTLQFRKWVMILKHTFSGSATAATLTHNVKRTTLIVQPQARPPVSSES